MILAEVEINIENAFDKLSSPEQMVFAKYVVNNLSNRSRERLLFHLAADFPDLTHRNDFTQAQLEKLGSLGIDLGEEWTLQNLLDCLPLSVDRVPQTKWIRFDNLDKEYEECVDDDGDYPNISGHLTISVPYGNGWVFDFDKEGINGVRPQDVNFTEAAIKMAEFCIRNDLM